VSDFERDLTYAIGVVAGNLPPFVYGLYSHLPFLWGMCAGSMITVVVAPFVIDLWRIYRT
jgi:hypothetical protein